MAEILDQLSEFIKEIIELLGYPGIALVMFAENIFTPIPSELVMPFAGFLVADEGKFSMPGVIIAGTLGSLVGAIVIYYIGVWADEPIIRRFVRNYGRYFLVSEQDLDRVLNIFEKYGEIIIFVGRLIPIIRSLISLPAGMKRMPLGRFVVFTTLGAGIWTALLAYAGYILGENWEDVLGYVDQYQKVTLAVLIVAVLAFVGYKVRDMWLQRKASAPADQPNEIGGN